MQTAFVAGATGYTGREVVRQLCEAGVRTIAHVRPDSPSLERWRGEFTAMGAVVDASAWDASSMRSAMQRHQPDVAYGLLGTTQARAKEAERAGAGPADYDTVDYGMTHMLFEALRVEVPSARAVYLSCYGARSDSRATYTQVRGRIEDELRASGLSFVIARPLFISGTDREVMRPAERIGTVVTDGLLAVVGLVAGRKVRDRYRSITGERLARALISAANDLTASKIVLEGGDLQRRADG